jgi:hypothetical protein
MSDSSLSDIPTELEGYDSYDTHNEPSLPTLLPPIHIQQDINPTPFRLQPPGQMLPPTSSILFTKLLYSRLILDSHPPTVKVTCLQLDCGYSPTPQPLSQTSTSNLWKHYTLKHPTVAYTMKGPTITSSSPLSSASSFFEPRPRNPQVQPAQAQASNRRAKYRELLLSFVVSNNLSLRLIKSHSFY